MDNGIRLGVMDAVLSSVVGRCLVIQLNRPDKKNALLQSMYHRLNELLTDAEHNHEIAVVVLKGHPTCFSSGNDISEFANASSMHDFSDVVDFLHHLSSFSKPIVASVSGLAVGVGMTLLFHCDVVIASENTVFQLPFISLGLTPEAGASVLIPAVCGYQRAAQWLLTGEPISAKQLMDAGLISQLTTPEALDEMTMKTATRISNMPLQALIETKRLLKLSITPSVPMTIAKELTIFGDRMQSQESKQAFAKFLKKSS